MVVSINPEPNRAEFETLINKTLTTLKSESLIKSREYSGFLGSKLEQVVADILTYNSVGTPFEGSIELVSGQKFPDIVANRFYGVEVKTTKSNHWRSTGSSVAEGTRIDDVERIFMLFGKMCDPIDFMCKPYEECLSEVVVTHSPRYLIDMNLVQGTTIFDKINMPYDTLRKQSDPIKTVLDYYKKRLKPGESTWWSGDQEEVGNNFIIRLWNNLSPTERHQYMLKGYCLFPELLSSSSDKFNRFAVWLSTREGIVCPNVRDVYTAGGQGSIEFEGKTHSHIPRAVIRMITHLDEIKRMLYMIDKQDLEEYWGSECSSTRLYDTWLKLVLEATRKTKMLFPIKEYLTYK